MEGISSASKEPGKELWTTDREEGFSSHAGKAIETHGKAVGEKATQAGLLQMDPSSALNLLVSFCKAAAMSLSGLRCTATTISSCSPVTAAPGKGQQSWSPRAGLGQGAVC